MTIGFSLPPKFSESKIQRDKNYGKLTHPETNIAFENGGFQ